MAATVLMRDSFKHTGKYPFYTLLLVDRVLDSSPWFDQIPTVIRQYGPDPQDVAVSAFTTKEAAYRTFKLFVGEEQPYVPKEVTA